MPHYFGCNIHNTGESCEGAIEGCSVSLSFFFFFPKFPFVFFSKKVGNVLSLIIQKVQWIESKRNWEKTLITAAWPPN